MRLWSQPLYAPTATSFALWLCAQIGEKRFVEGLGSSRVTARQYQVLALVAENEGASQTKIVGKSGIDRSTLADIVKRLVEGKLIARRRVKSDARAYELKLTDEGRQVLEDTKPALKRAEASLLEDMSGEQRDVLISLLTRVVEFDAKQQRSVSD